MTSNLSITVLRWFKNDVVNNVEELEYIYNTGDEFPLTVAGTPPGISLVINSASFAENDLSIVNFNATLTANIEDLYDMGYQRLLCGEETESDSFDIKEVDMEGMCPVILKISRKNMSIYIVQPHSE